MSENRSGPIAICEKCTTRFRTWRSDRQTRFCSRACAGRGNYPKKPSTKCEHCGVLFRRYGGGNTARFCSRACYRDSGGRSIADGYALVYAKGEPGAYKNGQIREHRLVMQRRLGRQLHRWETVHHINGDKLDNRPENLQLRTGRHGNGVHQRCADCGSTNIVTDPI